MKLFTGTYRALQKHFLKGYLGKLKTPKERVLFVLPSKRLKASLILKLTEQNGLVSGLYFADLTDLATGINSSLKENSKPLLPASPVQDFIIKDIAAKLPDINPSRGYRKALKAAFRDLVSAEVCVKDLLEIKNSEELPLQQQKDILGNFIVCYDEYLKKISKQDFFTYGQFFTNAINNTPKNPYLESFDKIIFYGFYDFTSLQYNLFKAVCNNFETEVYFPYKDTPAYSFTENFYKINILPLAAQKTILPEEDLPLSKVADNIFDPNLPKTKNADIKIISVSGITAEVQAAAKEILFLKEKHNIPFSEIALFARSIEPYKYDIPVIFAQNKIPVNFNFELPLLHHPFAAFVYNLLNLRRNDFYGADVCAVLASPYFTFYDPSWQVILKNRNISGGLSQWQYLYYIRNKGLNIPEQQYIEHSQKIISCLQELNTSYQTLEKPAPFDILAKTALDFLDIYIKKDLTPQETDILHHIKNIIRNTGSFSDIRKNASTGEFMEEILAAIKEKTYNKAQSFTEGVECGDIMALRGQNFKAAVFLGMNEGIMPATPAPDPVLKEEYRSLLKQTGVMIHSQIERYFEEKLLFNFALSSVEKKAVFICERSDNEGKDKIYSLYLNRIAQTTDKNLKKPDLVLSRRESEKLKAWPFEFLTAQEASVYTALYCPKDSILNCTFNPQNQKDDTLAVLFKNSALLRTLNQGLNSCDGIIERENILFSNIQQKGLSPSSLSKLWQCPFKYLAEFITQEDKPSVYDRAEIPHADKGNLYHKILEQFYKKITDFNLTDKILAGGAQNILNDTADEILNKENYKNYGLYPLVWLVTAKQMKEYLNNLVKRDLPILQQNNFTPYLFEYNANAQVQFGTKELKLHGKIDRIDINTENKLCRIIDYKKSPKDKNINVLIFSLAQLQPPLYTEIVKNSGQQELKGLIPQEALFLGIEADEDKKNIQKLTAEEYQAIKKDFDNAVNVRLDLAKEGIFFITPAEDACKYCPYDDICRKGHSPTLRRIKISNQARILKDADKVSKKENKNGKTTNKDK